MTHIKPEIVQELPHYRIDNIYPFIASLFVLLLTLGSFFVYLVRLSIVETKLDYSADNQLMMLRNQEKLSNEFTEWKRQAETRIGQVELEIAVVQDQRNR